MYLSYEQILERIDAFIGYAQRVQELKDSLLEIRTLADPEEVERNERHRIEMTGEIERIYQDHMLHIIKEIMDHVEENAREIREAVERLEEEGYDIMEMMESLLEDHRTRKAEAEREAEQATLNRFEIMG